MQLEQTSSALRACGERLFALIEELTGETPRLLGSGDWYRARSDSGVFVYLRFVGERSRTHPPHSVHLTGRWDDSFEGDERIRKGNNLHGEPSADVTARPDHPDEVAFAEEFVRRALELRRQNARRKPGRRN